MSIKVQCPNGHTLKVKDKYAGTTGLCPHCRSPVEVPVLHGLSDVDILDILGPPTPAAEHASDDEFVHQDAYHTGDGSRGHSSSGMSLISASMIRDDQNEKVCPVCFARVPYWHASCSNCKSYIPD